MPAGSEIRDVTLAASAANEHVFSDSFLRVIGGGGAMVSLAALSSAAGQVVSIQSGARTIMRQSLVSSAGAAISTNPNMDTDRVASFPAAPGEEIFVSVVDAGAGSTTRVLLVVKE